MRWRAIGVVATIGLGVAGYRAFDAWRARAALGAARREIDRGRFAVAARQLAALSARSPGNPPVELELGRCELSLGRAAAAEAAFRRVPPGSPLAVEAAVYLARIALRTHRLAEAEPLLRLGLEVPGTLGLEARMTLAHILKLQGRFDEVIALFEGGFDRLPEPVATLREFWRLRAEPFPVEPMAAALDAAGKANPDDDRVWLGKAHIATLTGRFEEADRWLSACEKARPRDPAVLRQRIAWARAAARPDAAARAVAALPDGAASPADVASWRAWFAALRRDEPAQRAALNRLLAFDPFDPRALERLAELDDRARPGSGAALRDRQARGNALATRYHRLLFSDDPRSRAIPLAEIARDRGWHFEARAWARLELGRHPAGSEGPSIASDPARTAPRPIPEDSLASLRAELPAQREPAPARSPAPSSIAFADAAAGAGLRFAYDGGGTDPRQLPTVMGGGVALLDFDGDGRLDVYLVQGGPFPPPKGARCGDALFRNRGDGSFERVRAGLPDLSGGYGLGVAVGDFDNDGDPDLFLTRWRSYALLRNDRGRFVDVTARFGLGGDRGWPTSAAFADLDGDGDLDLFVCHYLKWDEADPRECRAPTGRPVHCSPLGFVPEPDRVFRNDGDRFVDVSGEAGVADLDGRGLGVVATDLDDDGQIDLFVANDQSANHFYRNLGGFRFREQAVESGLASNANGGFLAGMGVACGDLDGDGRIDLAVTNFYGEGTTFYRNLGHGLFADHSAAIGLTAPSRYVLGFGAGLLDADGDGWPDLLTANGHLDDLRPEVPYAMPLQLFRGVGDGRVENVSSRAGPPFSVPRLARGLAIGDLDDDGRPDALVVSLDGPLAYLHNRTEAAGAILSLRLVGTRSNRDAVGAVVRVTTPGRTQVAHRFGGGSYQSASDGRLLFGLGPARRADRVEIRWPSGRVDRYRDLPAARHVVREGDPWPRPPTGDP